MAIDHQALARELLDAADRGTTIPLISARSPGFGWEDSYRVAAVVHRLRTARGEVLAGRKIGFTNRTIWPEYGATSPIWAPVYRDALIDAPEGHATLSLATSVTPKIEPEIAFRLRSPVPAGLKDPVAVLAHVDWMAPAFEIVHCHYPHWRFTPPDSAADAALHFRLIVGQPVRLGPDLGKLAHELRECRVALRRETEVMDIGTGANALGHPALALAFLADLLATQPFMPPLAAGEIVSTGTLTSALPVKPGETWSYDLAGIDLAPLEVTFTG